MTAGSVRRRILRASVAHNAAANLDDGKAAVAHFTVPLAVITVPFIRSDTDRTALPLAAKQSISP